MDKRYVVMVSGWPDEYFLAATRSKARYMAWRAFYEAVGHTWPGRFIDFAKGVRIKVAA